MYIDITLCRWHFDPLDSLKNIFKYFFKTPQSSTFFLSYPFSTTLTALPLYFCFFHCLYTVDHISNREINVLADCLKKIQNPQGNKLVTSILNIVILTITINYSILFVLWIAPHVHRKFINCNKIELSKTLRKVINIQFFLWTIEFFLCVYHIIIIMFWPFHFKFFFRYPICMKSLFSFTLQKIAFSLSLDK